MKNIKSNHTFPMSARKQIARDKGWKYAMSSVKSEDDIVTDENTLKQEYLNEGFEENDELLKSFIDGYNEYVDYNFLEMKYGIESSKKDFVKSARFVIEDENGFVIAEADTYDEAKSVGGTKIIDTQKEIQSSVGVDELSAFSHEIAKGVLSEKISLQKAVSRVMKELNCDEKYALTCVHSWIENEPTYNGMVMNSHKPIKSSFVINYYDEAGYVENNYIDVNAQGLVSSPNGAMQFDTMEDAQFWINTEAANNLFDPDYCEIQPVVYEVDNTWMDETREEEEIEDPEWSANPPEPIQSGIKDIAEDLNKDWNIDGNFESWSRDFIPDSGKAGTVGGEILRAANKIIYRWQNDGDRIGVGYGKETCNPPARYLVKIGVAEKVAPEMEEMINGEFQPENYDTWIYDLQSNIEDYLYNDAGELFKKPNKDSYENYRDDSDVDDSVSEIEVTDDKGNTYHFVHQGDDDWHCSEITIGNSEWNVGDTFMDGDEIADEVDNEVEYGSFTRDGYIFDWEAMGEPDEDEVWHEWEITGISIEDGICEEGQDVSGSDILGTGYEINDINGNYITEQQLMN